MPRSPGSRPVLVSSTVPLTVPPGASPWARKIACPFFEFATWKSPLACETSARGCVGDRLLRAAAYDHGKRGEREQGAEQARHARKTPLSTARAGN